MDSSKELKLTVVMEPCNFTKFNIPKEDLFYGRVIAKLEGNLLHARFICFCKGISLIQGSI